jgi:hypothetical protein
LIDESRATFRNENRQTTKGHEWHSLPHVASAELRDTLERLISSSDEEAVHIAADVINTLGAQGFLEFRSLLDSRRASQPIPGRLAMS